MIRLSSAHTELSIHPHGRFTTALSDRLITRCKYHIAAATFGLTYDVLLSTDDPPSTSFFYGKGISIAARFISANLRKLARQTQYSEYILAGQIFSRWIELVGRVNCTSSESVLERWPRRTLIITDVARCGKARTRFSTGPYRKRYMPA